MTEPTDKAEKARLATKAYRSRNKEQLRDRRATPEGKAKEREWHLARKADPLKWGKTVIGNIRSRAKALGYDFDLTAEDLIVPSHCPALGMALVSGVGNNSRALPNSPSVDRFDNAKGYVRGNVRVISLRANQLKSNATIEEMKLVLRYMEGQE